jgi:thioesterase domain-containing protein
LDNAPNTRLINEYGPTEAVVGCCVFEAAGANPGKGPVPIGRPIANVQLYLLDRGMNLAPVGAIGELFIGGESLARGYLAQAGLTAERFVPDPFTKEEGKKLYRTGDLCRRLRDGTIEFIGRIDDQVKIRGYRVELGEIEAQMRDHPAVSDCAVVVSRKPGDKRLAAFLVLNERDDHSIVEDVQSFLRARLPAYMLPEVIVVDALPITANGKVDRRALSSHQSGKNDRDASYIGPRDSIELRLVRLWEELLGASHVGVTDDFFARGGHSLLAVRLLSRIQTEFGRTLPLSTLFSESTVERMAALLRRQDAAGFTPLVSIQPKGSKPPFFCVHPAGGGVLCYRDLSLQLGKDQPFYGLQDPSLELDREPIGDVKEMALIYIDAIRSLVPRGPYLLGAYSFGGVVAFEMARRLIEQGETVSLLALIETVSPECSREILSLQELDEGLLLALNVKQEARVAGLALPLSISRVSRLDPESRVEHVLEEVRRSNLLSPEIGISEFRRYMRLHWSRREAIRNYQPQVYPGKITLLRTNELAMDDFDDLGEIIDPARLNAIREQESRVFQDPALGWQKLCTEPVDVHFVPGGHHTLLRDPHVRLLAETLEACIREVI